MPVSRRTFLGSAAAAAASVMPATRLLGALPRAPTASLGPERAQLAQRYDPWVEVIPAHLAHNVTTLRRLGGRPILAGIQNHGSRHHPPTLGRALRAHTPH